MRRCPTASCEGKLSRLTAATPHPKGTPSTMRCRKRRQQPGKGPRSPRWRRSPVGPPTIIRPAFSAALGLPSWASASCCSPHSRHIRHHWYIVADCRMRRWDGIVPAAQRPRDRHGSAARTQRCAGGSLLIAAVLARPLPMPVIKRVTEPARRQNASKCHQQGSDKRCPQDHRGSHDPKSRALLLPDEVVAAKARQAARDHTASVDRQIATLTGRA
jgi:hypothetical protein